MMTQQYSLSVILPAYNEGASIMQTVDEVSGFLRRQTKIHQFEIIVVDDGSTDRTADILANLAQSPFVKIITHPRNLGYGSAMRSGIKSAQFDWLLLMDADGQFKIDSLNGAIEYLSQYDIIAGYRNHRADSRYRGCLGKAYTFVACHMFGLSLKDINCGFKLFRRKALQLNGVPVHAGVFYTHIFTYCQKKGYRIKEIPVKHFPRGAGKPTGANSKVIANAILDLTKLIFSRN